MTDKPSNYQHKNGITVNKDINIILPENKSQSKPIKSKSIQFLKFGNYFSKSPIIKPPKNLKNNIKNKNKILINDNKGSLLKTNTLSVNTIATLQIKEEKGPPPPPPSSSSSNIKSKSNNKNNSQLISNFAGTGLIINNNYNDKRLSNSSNDTNTPKSFNSNSNSSDLNDNSNNQINHPIYFHNVDNDKPGFNMQQSINTRYGQMLKEYIETESTVSSSDIQDDISSIASDDSRRSQPPPPKNAPPPVPHIKPKLPTKMYRSRSSKPNKLHKSHIKSSSSHAITRKSFNKYSIKHHQKQQQLLLNNSIKKNPLISSQSVEKTNNKKNTNNLRIDTKSFIIKNKKKNKKPQSKSAYNTPDGSPTPHKVILSENDKINPYLVASQFKSPFMNDNDNKLNDNNIITNSLPPPPVSPRSAVNNKKSSLHTYRARKRTGSLPFYETPQMLASKSYNGLPHVQINNNKQPQIQINPFTPTRIAKKKKHGRANTEDLSSGNLMAYANRERVNRLHRRANSAKVVDDLSLSDKLYHHRRTVLHRLQRGKNKKDIMSKLDISIGKVEEKLKQYVRNLVSYQDEMIKINNQMNLDLIKWSSINNFNLTNICRSYYSNFKLLINIRIEIQTKYCECFRDKHRELRKTRDRIRKDARKYTLDDLILSVEAAMMTASNIRLPSDINVLRDNERALNDVVSELKLKYSEKKYDSIIKPMTTGDRTKHILTMLVQIIDTSNKTTTTRNISDGLPYFHPEDNGYQLPFEQLLYDPRFKQKNEIMQFRNKYFNNNNDINKKIIDKENLSLTRISTFVYKLTNSFLDSCSLNKKSPFFQKLFWDATNLMIGRSIFPKFENVIKYIINCDNESVKLDNLYAKQLIWMSTLTQSQIGIDNEFTFYYVQKRKLSLRKPKPSTNIVSDADKIAYYQPIYKFQSLLSIIVPQDSIVLVIDTVHSIQKCALKYHKFHNKFNNKKAIISGDTLFPIIVYCLIQSSVSYWYRWIFMMQKFYNKKILSFGQTGFCFSLISAAVKYILQQKPSNFGLDDDIK